MGEAAPGVSTGPTPARCPFFLRWSTKVQPRRSGARTRCMPINVRVSLSLGVSLVFLGTVTLTLARLYQGGRPAGCRGLMCVYNVPYKPLYLLVCMGDAQPN